VLLLTVNPRGGRSMWSGCERMPPSSRPGRRCWRGELLLATRPAGRRKAASAPALTLLSAPLTIPLVCCDIHGFRRVSRGSELRPGGKKRKGGWAAHPVEWWGDWVVAASRRRHRVVPKRTADGGIVYVCQTRSAETYVVTEEPGRRRARTPLALLPCWRTAVRTACQRSMRVTGLGDLLQPGPSVLGTPHRGACPACLRAS